MKKLICLLFVAFAILNAQEENGAFIGLEAGIGGMSMGLEYVDDIPPPQPIEKNPKHNLNIGAYYGVIVGYKHFINDYFGLRYYANANFANNKKDDVDIFDLNTSIKVDSMNVGVNFDVLSNFVNTKIATFGVYAGLGLGYYKNNLSAKGRDNNDKISFDGFDVGLNIGLRSVIAINHGIELGARVPFIETKSKSLINEWYAKIKPLYAVSFKYIYSF